MNLNIRKINNTPVRLVEFDGNVIGCFFYGDNYVAKEDFDATIWGYLNGQVDREVDEREVHTDSSGKLHSV